VEEQKHTTSQHHQEHTVNTNQHRRSVQTLTITAVAVALGALPAAARQDAGPAHLDTGYPYFKVIERVGTQLTAGDNTTGNGVLAPAWVDER
jgi:hypothetical protein